MVTVIGKERPGVNIYRMFKENTKLLITSVNIFLNISWSHAGKVSEQEIL